MMASQYRHFELLRQYAQISRPGCCPEGMYIASTSSLDEWSGVVFVRKGLFAGGIFQFRLVFPVSFPQRAPDVYFQKGSLMHPLVETKSDRLAIASAFPTWNPRTDTVMKLLYFIKGIFKSYNLRQLNDGLAINNEAWRLYQSQGSVFAKLASQCVSTSKTANKLYAEGGRNIAKGSEFRQGNEDDRGIKFSQLSEDEMEAARQALFNVSQ